MIPRLVSLSSKVLFVFRKLGDYLRLTAKLKAYNNRETLKQMLGSKLYRSSVNRIFKVAQSIADNYEYKQKIRSMWVSKGGKVQKGTEIQPEDYKYFRNEPHRVIQYLSNKKLRKDCKEIAFYISLLLSHKNNRFQHGFIPNRSGTTLMYQLKNAQYGLKIDFHDAFHDMKQSDVFYTLNVTLDLNKELAQKLTNWSTFNGMAYQGCPFVPALFDIFLCGIENHIDNWRNIRLLSYADDTYIVAPHKISWRVRKHIISYFQDWGLIINHKKTKWIKQKGAPNILGINWKTQQSKKLSNYKNRIRNLHKIIIHESGKPRLHYESVKSGISSWINAASQSSLDTKKETIPKWYGFQPVFSRLQLL